MARSHGLATPSTPSFPKQESKIVRVVKSISLPLAWAILSPDPPYREFTLLASFLLCFSCINILLLQYLPSASTLARSCTEATWCLAVVLLPYYASLSGFSVVPTLFVAIGGSFMPQIKTSFEKNIIYYVPLLIIGEFIVYLLDDNLFLLPISLLLSKVFLGGFPIMNPGPVIISKGSEILSKLTGSNSHEKMSQTQRIAYFGLLNLAFMFIQLFYGYVTGSLGLLTDSIHMFFDCLGLAVGLCATVMSKWPASTTFPYGFSKIESLSGFANGIFLILVSGEIVFDAIDRLYTGNITLKRLDELLVVSIVGLVVNLIGLVAFGHEHHGHHHGHDHSDENMQGIFLHIVADALGSFTVIVSTLLTKYNSWNGWDPLASCLIAILIILSAIPLVQQSGINLIISLPNDAEYTTKDVLHGLMDIKGIIGYSGVRLWQIEEDGHSHDHDHHPLAHTLDHHHDNNLPHREHEQHDHQDHHHHHHHHHEHEQHGHQDHHEHNHHCFGSSFIGSIHVLTESLVDLQDLRRRADEYLKGKGYNVIIQVERASENPKCWCVDTTY